MDKEIFFLIIYYYLLLLLLFTITDYCYYFYRKASWIAHTIRKNCLKHIVQENWRGTPTEGEEESSWQMIWSRYNDTGHWRREPTIGGDVMLKINSVNYIIYYKLLHQLLHNYNYIIITSIISTFFSYKLISKCGK